MRIVGIGGGDLAAGATLPIDRRIVELTGKRRPLALFVPTASTDSREYAAIFAGIYGDRLGCTIDTLYLLGTAPPPHELAERIGLADLVYVGGGNTLRLMRRWRRLGVDRLLREAGERGAVLCGVSAGFLCWCAYGHSDSMSFYHPDDWDYIRVRGMGLLPITGCPHYDGEGRDRSFQAMIIRSGGVGIALDDRAAIEVHDDRYRIIAAGDGPRAYRVARHRGGAVQTPISPGRAFEPIADLIRGPDPAV